MILLILVGLVLVFGVGVVVYNRRTSAPLEVEEAPAKVAVQAGADVEAEVDVEVEEPAPAPGAVRRFARAAGIFNGSFAVLRGKDKITSETWEELEETLPRADVGLQTTTALLDTLKSRVGRKDISTPQELLDALQPPVGLRQDGAPLPQQPVPYGEHREEE